MPRSRQPVCRRMSPPICATIPPTSTAASVPSGSLTSPIGPVNTRGARRPLKWCAHISVPHFRYRCARCALIRGTLNSPEVAVKAEVAQQVTLLELTELDAELSRLAHRAAHLPEQQHLDEVRSRERSAADRLAALGILIADLDAEVARLESEVDAVRKREDRDRGLLDSGSVNPKQLEELQHELDTLERRQGSLEDSLLEVMERREQLAAEHAGEQAVVAGLRDDLVLAEEVHARVLAEIEATRTERVARRSELVSGLDADLVKLYERQAATSGVGAGRLAGGRCGACRIELDRGELARITAAADDEVLRCSECGAILLRVRGPGS